MPKYLEDFVAGERIETPARTVTEADVVAFAGLSGDYNPIHTDAEFAAGTPFGQRIAHGLLGLSIASGLAGRTGMLEGTALAFLAIEDWRFAKPILFGDTVRARITVLEARASSKPGAGVLKRRIELVNQRGEVVQGGTFVTLVKARGK
ncbi:MAG: MaoC/PaaZ C-terminal domain-containing protein [Burkholderiales bacterium]|nr:MaoC/PaaZ C-terminal domain-containing protein [Burkholderiales bacterium]